MPWGSCLEARHAGPLTRHLAEEVPVQALYRAMDFLVEHGEAIQKALFFSASSLLNLEVDLLFFDTTSTYFEIEEPDAEGEGPRRHGNSKDHRPDLPQVVIGLAVTREGLPVRCWVLPGNRNDASLVEQIQRDMAGWKLPRVVWVMDRGMTGESQRLALQRGGGHAIIGEKLRGGAKLAQEALKRPGPRGGVGLPEGTRGVGEVQASASSSAAV